MTAAHAAGFTRLFITPVTLLLLSDWQYSEAAVIAAVIVAIITDILDGYLARRFNTVSTFGIYLDLTADKVFLCTLLVILSVKQQVPVWMTVVIICREFIVMGLRSYAAAEGVVVPAKLWGKLKTIVLFPALLGVLLELPFVYWAVSLATVLALISCVDYVFTVKRLVNRKVGADAGVQITPQEPDDSGQ